MRRLKTSISSRLRREEQGAMAVLVAILMVALLGCAAIAVDVGLIYSERAQLQNGADAAALAVAADCAGGDCGNATATAQHFANRNANDGVSAVLPPVFAGNSVTVWTEAQAAGSSTGGLPLFFARIFGINSTDVRAQATATWSESVSVPSPLPLVFAPCEVELTGYPVLLTYHGTANCSSTSPSGQNLPGGFGWVDQAEDQCGISASVSNSKVSSDTGNNLPNNCKPVLDSLKDTTVWFPVYADSGGQGTNAWYEIQGWAAFHLTGFKFGGGPDVTWNEGACTGNCRGVIGTVTDYIPLKEGHTIGVPGAGAPTVSLTE